MFGGLRNDRHILDVLLPAFATKYLSDTFEILYCTSLRRISKIQRCDLKILSSTALFSEVLLDQN